MRDRTVERVQRQRLLMPVLIELLPEQMVTFAAIAEELDRNGFRHPEPVRPPDTLRRSRQRRSVGLEALSSERMLEEVLALVTDREQQVENEEARLDARIAASIACHAAIKVNYAS